MKQLLFLAALTILASHQMQAQQNVNGSLVFDGINRLYTVHIPTNYEPGSSLPLVINMHGFGSNRQQQQLYANMDPIADENNFFIVYPDGVSSAWNVGWDFGSTADDVGFINALIDQLIADYNIDNDRVYSTGMSNGGFMSYVLVCELPNRIAAIASVTGGMVPNLLNSCDPGRAIPIMQIHGTEDDVVPYGGNLIAAPVESTVNFWVTNNSCNDNPLITDIEDIDPDDGSTAQNFRYGECDESSDVEFYRIEGGGHTWPGAFIQIGSTNQDFDASEEIWRFFDQFSLSGSVSNKEVNVASPTLRINPNPFQDRIQIELEGLEEITIFDTSGREQLSTKLTSGSSVSLAHLPSGVYLISIQVGEHQLLERIVKR